jgi:hypothetical protein
MAIVATKQEPDDRTATSPTCAVPAGTAHALDLGAPRTRCGIEASTLVPWPELTWPPPGMAAVDTCPDCAG